jgi:hypothetical protein
MRSLIWKEWRENIKWVGLPALFLLLPMALLGGPSEPMINVGGAVLLFFVTAVFGAALGFMQIFFESRGDHRAILLHRPLSRSRIFLDKVVAGVTIYLLAMLIPFLALTVWMATPGNVPAPYHWQTALPWLADILAGLVFYFAGMLTAQREARWYGSRCLGLAAAFGCTMLVWSVPEFWQALLTILIVGAALALAAWGSFLAGGAYAPQPRLAKSTLAVTLLGGLLVVSLIGKFLVGGALVSGMRVGHTLDRQGRLLIVPWKSGFGPVGPVTDLEGRVPPDLEGKRVDRNLLEEIEAPTTGMDWPMHQSYRNPSRFYVMCMNATMPGAEVWYYASDQGRVLGYDEEFGQFIGSFGPDGFVPAGQETQARFEGDIRCSTRLWDAFQTAFLVFSRTVYSVNFSRRTVQTLFTAAEGETVRGAGWWRDRRDKHSMVLVSTDKSIYFLTAEGAPLVAVPRAFDTETHASLTVGRLEHPPRYVVWYGPSRWLEPEVTRTMFRYVLEYDAAGTEIARRALPRPPSPEPSPAQALFGLATPLPETVVLAGGTRWLRSRVQGSQGMEVLILTELLEMWITQFMPESIYAVDTRSALFAGFTGLSLLSSMLCALVCCLLARRYFFSRAGIMGWTLCGLVFGPAGLLLMLSLEEWPARIPCHVCRRPRRVDRERCEHCAAVHAAPAPDGTEVFETPSPAVVRAEPGRGHVYQAATLDGGGRL